LRDKQAETFDALLDSLIDPTDRLRAALIYRLSDPAPEDFALLKQRWHEVPVERRQLLLSRMAESSETNFDLDFSTVAQFALQDEDPTVRRYAISALWISEDIATMHTLIHLLQMDEAAEVRAAAAEALGRFVLAGELGDLPDGSTAEAESALLEVFDSDHEELDVQRRALESLAYSGREGIDDLIDSARQHESIAMQATALFAMGRSANRRWARYVIRALDEAEPELRYEAARAAGELGLASTVPRLARLARDPDREIREAAIWSLGEIGGLEAQNVLLRLMNEEDDGDLLEAIEDSINTAALSTGDFVTYMFTPSADFEDEDEFDDLEDDDET